MNRLQQQAPFFQALARQPNQVVRKSLLEQATKDQINMMSEVVLNLLKNRIPVTQDILTKLRPYKNILRALRQRKNSLKKCRQLLMEAKGNKLFHGLYDCVCVC